MAARGPVGRPHQSEEEEGVAALAAPRPLLPAGLLPVTPRQIAAALASVGAAPRGRPPLDPAASGYGICLSLPAWVAEHAGSKVPRSFRRVGLRIQACLLVHLQLDDDEVDGQAQLPLRVQPGHYLREAELDLRLLLGRRDEAFWPGWRGLLLRQRRARDWELAVRFPPPLPFDAQLKRRLSEKAAVLRWPALAAQAFGRDAGAELDEPLRRVLAATMLLDDLADVDEDLQRGQVNAVLCAAGARKPTTRQLVAGAAAVIDHVRRELRWIGSATRSGSLRRFCERTSAALLEGKRAFAAERDAGLHRNLSALFAARASTPTRGQPSDS